MCFDNAAGLQVSYTPDVAHTHARTYNTPSSFQKKNKKNRDYAQGGIICQKKMSKSKRQQTQILLPLVKNPPVKAVDEDTVGTLGMHGHEHVDSQGTICLKPKRMKPGFRKRCILPFLLFNYFTGCTPTPPPHTEKWHCNICGGASSCHWGWFVQMWPSPLANTQSQATNNYSIYGWF